MRRRTPLNMWPSIADLMTVLAVPAVMCAVGIYPLLANLGGARSRQGDLARTIPDDFRRALNAAEAEMQDLAKELGVQVGEGQAIRFGEELVRFERNGVEVSIASDKEDAFWQRCQKLSAWYEKRKATTQSLVILVEGHADQARCAGDPRDWCNWHYSSMRAANFIDLMSDERKCRGISRLPLRGSAMASQKPATDGTGQVDQDASRRIEIKIAPDYEALVMALRKK